METQTYLSDNWSYTQLTPTRFPTGSKLGTDKQEEKAWHKTSKFPTSIHVELEKRGEIPDHRKGLNEWDIQVSHLIHKAKVSSIDRNLLYPSSSGSENPTGDSRPRSN